MQRNDDENCAQGENAADGADDLRGVALLQSRLRAADDAQRNIEDEGGIENQKRLCSLRPRLPRT